MATLIRSDFTHGTGNLGFTAWTPTTGNFFVVIAEIDDATTTPTIADNLGNTYTAHSASPFTFSTNGLRYYVWYVKSALAGSTTITITKGTVNATAFVLEYSGLNTTSPEDGSSGAESAGSVNPNPGTIVATTGGIVIGVVADNAAPTAVSGYTQRQSDVFLYFSKVEDETTPHSAGGSFTPSWTATSNNWAAIGLAFKNAGGAPADPLMGVVMIS